MRLRGADVYLTLSVRAWQVSAARAFLVHGMHTYFTGCTWFTGLLRLCHAKALPVTPLRVVTSALSIRIITVDLAVDQ